MSSELEMLNRIEYLATELGRERLLREQAETKVKPETEYMNVKHVHDLIDALADERKIDAIKAFRTLTGYGLKESKDAIERVTGLYSLGG